MAKPNQFILVHITTKNEDEARMIASLLVEKREAACVSIIPRVSSSFYWENSIQCCSESLLLVKARKDSLDTIIQLVRTVHSYELPEIIAFDICGGDERYLSWIEEATST